MSHTSFDALPAGSRIWVFVADRTMTPAEEESLHGAADKFLDIWKHKAEHIRGCYEVREHRFFLVGSDETDAALSGCSIDAMMARLAKVEQETGLHFTDRTKVFYRDAAGGLQAVSRPQFRTLLARGEVGPDTMVIDTTLSRIEQLREQLFEVPMKSSWHAQAFLQAATPA